MKKYVSLLLFALILNGCDDGDLTVDEIAFDTITPVSCSSGSTSTTPDTGNSLIYQLKEQEALLLQMPASKGIINADSTYIYDIDASSYRVVYRAYDGKVASTNLCNTIPPSTPNVTEEWLAGSGVINITSAAISDPGPNEGSTRITGYSHSIDFTNITFNRSNGVPQTYATYPFGNIENENAYTTSVTKADLTFANANDALVLAFACPNNQIYNYNSSFYLMIDNPDPTFLENVEGTKTFYITATTNKIYYRTTKANTGTLTSDYFCKTPAPLSPSIEENWNGEIGVANVSGMIEVTTTKAADTYFHKITLRSVALKKGKTKFQLGNSFLLGTVSTK